MKPSQFNLIRRMWIRATRYRYREKDCKKEQDEGIKAYPQARKECSESLEKRTTKVMHTKCIQFLKLSTLLASIGI